MLFGDSETFRIEAMVEPGPELPAIRGKAVFGRVRVWLSGLPVGNFDEPCCSLGPIAQHLLDHSKNVGKCWDDSLDGLSPSDIFVRLDHLLFAFDLRTDSLVDPDSVPDAPEGLKCSGFLTNASEAFDGWKGFLLSPPGEDLLILIKPHSHPEILDFWVPSSAYTEATSRFSYWLDGKRSELMGWQ